MLGLGSDGQLAFFPWAFGGGGSGLGEDGLCFDLGGATFESVHAGVDADEIGEEVEDFGGEEAGEGCDFDEAGHDEFGLVLFDGGDDFGDDVAGFEDGEQPAEAGFDAFKHAGVDVVGADDGCFDAGGAVAQFHSEGFVEADGGEFTGAVVGEFFRSDESGGGGDGDDVAFATFEHVGEEGFGGPEEGEGVDAEGLDNLFIGEVEEVVAADDAGVVDEDVDASDFVFDLLGGGVDGFAVGDITGEAEDGASGFDLDVADGFVEEFGVDIAEDHGGAEAGHGEGEVASEAVGGAGDKDFLAVELGHCLPSFFNLQSSIL